MYADSQEKPLRWVIYLLVALIVIAPLLMLMAMYWADSDTTSGTHFGMMGSFEGSWWLIMIIPAVAILVVLMAVILIAAEPAHSAPYAQPLPPQTCLQYGAQGGRAEEPQAILDRRLASGEIGVDEYNRLRDELRKH